MQTAYEVVQPLQGFPKIASCSIRLGQFPDDSIRQLAETTAHSLTRTETTFFQFPRLPVELQETVLESTDLVSPLSLSWTECGSNGGRPASIDTSFISPGCFIGFPSGRSYGSNKALRQFEDGGIFCCMQCTEAGEVCACPARHAACTTNACRCWHFPSALFLVNKNINHLAKNVFFTQNKFIFSDEHTIWGNYVPLADDVAILPNLSQFAFFRLRWICLYFNSLRRPIIAMKMYTRWQAASQLIKEQLETNHLTLELNCAYAVDESYEYHHDDAQEDFTWSIYQDIVDLFRIEPKRLHKAFFVRLASPLAHFQEDDMKRWQRERILEKRIMGEDYDAAAHGKYGPQVEGYMDLIQSQPARYGPDGTKLNPDFGLQGCDETFEPRKHLLSEF